MLYRRLRLDVLCMELQVKQQHESIETYCDVVNGIEGIIHLTDICVVCNHHDDIIRRVKQLLCMQAVE